MFKPFPWVVLFLLIGGQVAGLTLVFAGPGRRKNDPAMSPGMAGTGRVDHYGDPLPPGALARLGTLRLGFRARDWTVTSSQDGRILLAGGTRDLPLEGGGLAGFGGAVGLGGLGGLAGGMPFRTAKPLSPWLKIGNDAPVLFLEAATGRLLRSVHVHPAGVDGLALSPDGKLLAVNLTVGPLQLRDAATGKLVRGLDGDVQGTASLAFSPDGAALAVLGRESRGCLLEVRTGRVLHRFGPATGGRSLAYAPDGKTIACGGDQAVTLWNAKTGKQLWRLPLPFSVWLPLCFTPDGRSLAVAGGDGVLRLIAPASGKVVRQWEADPGLLFALAFAPSGLVLASAGDGTIRLWDLGSTKEVRRLEGCGKNISSLAFSRDGKVLAAGSAEGVQLWDVTTGGTTIVGTEHRAPVAAVAFSPEGRTLASRDRHGNGLLWEVPSGKPLPLLPKLRGRGAIRAFSPDGKLCVTASKDGSLHLGEWADGTKVRRLRGHTKEVHAAAFSPDGKVLISASTDDGTRLWDVVTGRELRRGKASTEPWRPTTFAFLPGGCVLVAGNNKWGGAHLFDAFTGEQIRWLKKIYKASGGNVWAVALTPDGRSLVEGGAGSIGLWDVRTGKEVRRFEESERHISALAVTPDGRTVISKDDNGLVRLWEAASGRQVLSFHGHCADVSCLALSPDGRTLATGSNHFTILLWDATGLQGADRAKTPPTAKNLARYWDALGGRDAAAAHRAAWRLADSSREGIMYLARQLKPVPALSAERLRHLVADLSHRRFRVRQAAFDELERAGVPALPGLRKALQGRPSLEMRRRTEELLRMIQSPIPSVERLREIRAVAVLERSGDARARELLRALAGGLPGARLTEEANAALKRLGKRIATP